ncbi:MAG: hypothetical protein J7M38_14855 [Armatimonadetes bacterium]|nr:hypothetical protein [Armatimonadota bacterium]
MREDYIETPSALTLWTLGTGFLGGVASWMLSKRAEKERWSKFKTGYVIAGIVAASALNIWIASKIEGEK